MILVIARNVGDEAISGMMGWKTFDVEIASQVPVIARLDRAIQKLA